MASIEDVVHEFYSYPDEDELALIHCDLDIGLMHVGKMAAVTYDLMVHPPRGLDHEAVIASLKGLLAYVGHLGGRVDALGRLMEQERRNGTHHASK